MEQKLEKSNDETQKTTKDSIHNILKDFRSTLIESVPEIITNQIEKSNKYTMTGVQEIIFKQAEESNKYMMEAIQTAMKVSTLITITLTRKIKK